MVDTVADTQWQINCSRFTAADTQLQIPVSDKQQQIPVPDKQQQIYSSAYTVADTQWQIHSGRYTVANTQQHQIKIHSGGYPAEV